MPTSQRTPPPSSRATSRRPPLVATPTHRSLAPCGASSLDGNELQLALKIAALLDAQGVVSGDNLLTRVLLILLHPNVAGDHGQLQHKVVNAYDRSGRIKIDEQVVVQVVVSDTFAQTNKAHRRPDQRRLVVVNHLVLNGERLQIVDPAQFQAILRRRDAKEATVCVVKGDHYLNLYHLQRDVGKGVCQPNVERNLNVAGGEGHLGPVGVDTLEHGLVKRGRAGGRECPLPRLLLRVMRYPRRLDHQLNRLRVGPGSAVATSRLVNSADKLNKDSLVAVRDTSKD
mmetsp:Transcript_15435/g.48198  ORF Transcript_15435/g.48198 Transcript_15435/m.48198 type:complete len:285 (-) Transcript_15435:1917-2771(-)